MRHHPQREHPASLPQGTARNGNTPPQGKTSRHGRRRQRLYPHLWETSLVKGQIRRDLHKRPRRQLPRAGQSVGYRPITKGTPPNKATRLAMHKHLAPGSPATQSNRPRTRAPEKVRRPGRERIRKTASSTIRVRSLQQLLIAHGARIWHRHLAGRRAVRGTPPAKRQKWNVAHSASSAAKRQKWNIAAPIKRHATVAPMLTSSRSAARQQRQSSLKEPRQSAHTSTPRPNLFKQAGQGLYPRL